VEVIDGRTVKVLLDGDGRVFSVRYIGVASPDTSRGPSLPAAALARNAQLAYHKQATLVRDITDADPNGTLLRYVMVEHVFVNYAILAGGYVRAASSPPDTACLTALTEAENLAKSSGLGVWAAPFNDTPPPATP
jgi:endonuclease YncB( thermonuclease family)